MLSYQETYQHAIERRELNERIKALIVESLEVGIEPAQITDDEPLFGRGLGLDSLDALELVVGIEEAFEISISDDDISALSSVNKIADYITASREGRIPDAPIIFGE